MIAASDSQPSQVTLARRRQGIADPSAHRISLQSAPQVHGPSLGRDPATKWKQPWSKRSGARCGDFRAFVIPRRLGFGLPEQARRNLLFIWAQRRRAKVAC